MWEGTPGCGEAPFLDSLWTAIDEAVGLRECEVYSYKSDGETDPFGARACEKYPLHGALLACDKELHALRIMRAPLQACHSCCDMTG